METKTLHYQDGNTTLHGYLAFDESRTSPMPGIIIAHAWGGCDEFVCQKAEYLAKLGYVGFAWDIYGEGKQGSNPDENAKLMMPFLEDRKLLRKRLLAAYNAICGLEIVDKTRIGAMGFCFGGLCVLDLARSGADVKGVVSFHGLFNPPEGLATQKITAKVLALHGHDDPMVPPEQVAAFQQEMTDAGVDWQIHIYGHTKHAFTNPKVNDQKLGTVYNPVAEKRALQSMENFFAQVLE